MRAHRKTRCCALAAAITFLATTSASAYIAFDPERLVTAGGVEIDVPGYSVPSLVDWNSDGLPDLMVGEGTTTGKVRVYVNDGDADAPHFSSYSYVQSLGSDLVVLGGG